MARDGHMDLSKPHLRAEMERGMGMIARGQRSKAEFMAWCDQVIRQCYQALENRAGELDAALGQHFRRQEDRAREGAVQQAAFCMCRCGTLMDLRIHGAVAFNAAAAANPGRAG